MEPRRGLDAFCLLLVHFSSPSKPVEARPQWSLNAFCLLLVHFSSPSKPVEALADLALYNTKRESESLDGLKTCQASLLLEF